MGYDILVIIGVNWSYGDMGIWGYGRGIDVNEGGRWEVENVIKVIKFFIYREEFISSWGSGDFVIFRRFGSLKIVWGFRFLF